MSTMTHRNCILLKLLTHPSHDGDGLEGEKPRVSDLVVDDAVEHLLFVVARERGLTHQHLEDLKKYKMTVLNILSGNYFLSIVQNNRTLMLSI